jgi:hypothetical protein
MEDLLAAYPVPEEKEMLLYTYVRLAHGFSDYATRLKSVQARLQALSVLIYSNQLTDSIQVICMISLGRILFLAFLANARWDRLFLIFQDPDP